MTTATTSATKTTTATKPVKKDVAMKVAAKPVKKAARLNSKDVHMAMMVAAKKPVKKAVKSVAKAPAKKVVKAKKPVVKVPRLPRLTNDQRQMLAVQKFEARKLVSGLIESFIREADEKIVTHVDQPEVKAILNKDVFVRDHYANKLVKLGRVAGAVCSVSGYEMGLFNIYKVWVDDGEIALHQIRKVGTKFVYDASLPMPNKRQTHLLSPVDFDKPRGRKTASNVDPAAAVKREQLNQTHGYAKAAEIADKADLKMTYAEGELRATDLKKGSAITIDPSIRGDVIKMTKIVVEGKGTKRSPFVKRRYVFTEKGQKCPAFELKLVRGKLKNTAV